jgi:hypothetical protein
MADRPPPWGEWGGVVDMDPAPGPPSTSADEPQLPHPTIIRKVSPGTKLRYPVTYAPAPPDPNGELGRVPPGVPPPPPHIITKALNTPDGTETNEYVPE